MTAAVARPIASQLSCADIAHAAVAALHDEVDLTPKPGLVDRRGPGAHSDMSLDMLHTSADALHTAFGECASAASELDVGAELRERVGVIGRVGERTMLTATGGVNTHRGALWALGLLCAAAGAGAQNVDDTVAFAGRLARLPDPAQPTTQLPGARARRRYHVGGAPAEAQADFPHITRYALPALRADPTTTTTVARLHALLALMARIDDTCLLHRGGPTGLTSVRCAAHAAAASDLRTDVGWQRFWELDRLCRDRGLSPGGSGDLLAATLFLDRLDTRSELSCKP